MREHGRNKKDQSKEVVLWWFSVKNYSHTPSSSTAPFEVAFSISNLWINNAAELSYFILNIHINLTWTNRKTFWERNNIKLDKIKMKWE